MKQNFLYEKSILHTAICIFSGLLSSDAVAQININPKERSTQTFPKKLYIEKYLANQPRFIEQVVKVRSNESFDYYRLPLDNMLCVMPTKDITFHMRVYDPGSSGEFVENIPNAFLRMAPIK